MTINEANAINVLVRYIFDIDVPMASPPDDEAARRAAAIAASGAYKRLAAGVHVADVQQAAFRERRT
jgi:hypothetical protein